MIDWTSPEMMALYFVLGGIVATLIYRYLPQTVKDRAIAIVVEAEIYLDALEHEVPESVAPTVTELKETVQAFYKAMEDGKFSSYELMAVAKEIKELWGQIKVLIGK